MKLIYFNGLRLAWWVAWIFAVDRCGTRAPGRDPQPWPPPHRKCYGSKLAPAPFFGTDGSVRFVRSISILVLLATMMSAAAAVAQDRHTLSYRNVVVLQGNPVLLRDMAAFDYRYRMFEAAHPLLRNNFLGFSLRPTLSPGFARVGAGVEVAPLSILRVGVGWERVTYFGTFDQLQSFPDADVDYRDSNLRARGEAEENYAASGTDLSATLLLQNRFGPFIVRDLFELHKMKYDLRPGDAYFYEPVLDILIAQDGWAWSNDLDALYISPFGLIAGLRYSIVGSPSAEVAPTHRFGPSLSYVVFQNPGAAFDSATIFALVNWWLGHPYRTGEDVSAAVPFVSVGFSFTGEIL